MANFNNIKHEIDQNVNTNGQQAITGAILNQTLKDMLDDVDLQKQDALVSGQNIKTINNQSLLGSGNITIQGGSGSDYYAGQGIDIDENNVISVDGADVAGRGLTSNGSQVDLDLSQVIGDGLDWSGDDPVLSVDASDLAGFGLTTDGNGNLAVDTNTIASQSDLANKQDTLTFNLPININGDNSIELLYGDGLTMGVGDALVANLGNGLQFDADSAIEVDTNTVATQQDLATKQDALTAGDGVEIDGNNEISVKAGSGLGFDANGYLINTGGGGGGQTLVAGDGIEIDSNDAINAKLGNGLQLDANNNIEIDPSVVASQSDLSAYLRNDASGQIQNFLDGTGDTELTVMDGMSEDYVRLGAYETQGEQPHIEIFENGSGDTKFFYDHIERGSQVSIDLPSSSGTLALTSDIPSASDLDGWGLTATQGGELEVDGSVLAGTGITWDPLNKVFNATGGSGSSLWVSDRGVDSLLSPGAHSNSISYASGQGAINAGNYSQADSQGGWISAAIGDFSTTFGTNTSATGDNSTAFGFKTKAEGDNSFVMGTTNSASGDNAFAGGSNASAFADNTFAFNGDALGQGSVAIGIGSEANGMNSVAIGSGARTDSMYAIALGTNSSAVAHSTAVGYNVSTGNAYETATGEFNKTYASNTYSSDSDKTHFSIGNGTDGNNRSNAFEIKKNNDAYLVGVGNYDGTNAGQAGVSTLQAVINSGGQGTVYSSGQGIDITNNTISVDATDLDGSGLSVDANGALEVDTTTIQEKLVSGTNLKTINGNSLLGSGDLVISGGQSLSAGSGIDITSNVISVEPDLTLESLTVKNDTNSNLTTVSCSSPNTTGNIRSVNINVSKDVSGAPGKSNINLQSDGNYASAGDTYSVGLNNNGSISVSYKDSGNQSQVATINYPQKSGTIALLSDISGGGGTSFTPGDALELDANDNLNVLYGSGLTLSANNELEVDPNSITGFLPDVGGALQQTDPNETATFLSINSPLGNGAIELVSDDDYDGNGNSKSQITLSDNDGAVFIRTDGVSDGTYTTSWPSPSADTTFATLDDIPDINNSNSLYYRNGNIPEVVDSLNIYALQCQDLSGTSQTAICSVAPTSSASACLYAEDEIDQYEQPTGNGIAKVNLSDTSGDIIVGTDGILDNNTGYKLSFPTLTQNDTIATLSDIQSGGFVAGSGIDITSGTISVDETYLDSVYLPILGGTLENTANHTDLKIAAPHLESTAYADINVNGTTGTPYLELFSETSVGTDAESFKINGLGNFELGYVNGTSDVIELPHKAGTIALLSDITGGSAYTAGAGISIDANNVISNSAPDPGLWAAGNGINSIRTSTASSGAAGGAYSIVIGDNTEADGGYSMALGSRSKVYGSNLYATAIAGGQVGTFGSSGYQNAVAIGYSAYCTAADTIALGVGARSFNQGEISIGYYANAISSGTTAEKTRFTVGNGSSGSARSNLIEAKQNNDLYIYGVGSFDGTNASASSSLQSVINGKQDTLTAGSGISIVNNVISTTGGGGGGSSLWTNGTGTDSLVAPATITAGLSVDPAQGTGAISCGYDTNADGDYAFAQGAQSTASGDYSFAANNGTASGDYSASFGSSGAYGNDSFAAGTGSIAGAQSSVALAGGLANYDDSDPYNIINAEGSVAIGNGSAANAYQAIVIGSSASTSDIAIDGIAIGVAAYANAQEATAIGSSSTAEGIGTVALSSGVASGERSTAMSSGSAIGDYSIAGGLGALTGAYSSVALGFQTMTYDQGDPTDPSEANAGEAAFGRYNYTEQDFIFTVGCGQEIYHDPDDPDFEPNPEDPDSPDGWTEIVRQNAITITTDGSIYIKGAGGYLGQGITGADSLQTLLYNLNPQ